MLDNMTEEQQKYCIHQCKQGKQKVHELLHICDSVFDVVEDMQSFIKECWKKGCPYLNKNLLN